MLIKIMTPYQTNFNGGVVPTLKNPLILNAQKKISPDWLACQ
jgi:hypothetical protein